MANEKKWWKYLLLIPGILVADVILFVVAALADTMLAADATSADIQGHAVPVFSIVVLMVMSAVTVMVIVVGLALAIRAARRSKKNRQIEENGAEAPPENKKWVRKPVWKVFIPLAVQLVMSVFVVCLCGSIEINNFYNDPEHIGFAVPVLTFLLAGFFLVLAAITFVVSLIVAIRRNRKNREIS